MRLGVIPNPTSSVWSSLFRSTEIPVFLFPWLLAMVAFDFEPSKVCPVNLVILWVHHDVIEVHCRALPDLIKQYVLNEKMDTNGSLSLLPSATSRFP